jgi:hypothetical protein
MNVSGTCTPDAQRMSTVALPNSCLIVHRQRFAYRIGNEIEKCGNAVLAQSIKFLKTARNN